MTVVRIDLNWWPPHPGEPIDEARALELVVTLKRIAGPVVEAAAADLRRRIGEHPEIIRSGAPASYVARFRFDDLQVRSLCVGTPYQVGSGDPASNSIHLHRDGRLAWQRD